MTADTPREPVRFWSKADTSGGADACWPWTAALQRSGYGIFGEDGRSVLAHRVAYRLVNGPIPEDLTIDHLCRNRRCVNPTHMEPVTGRENTLRGMSQAAQNAKVTHCPKGHEYTPENTEHRPRGSRHCLACRHVADLVRRTCSTCGVSITRAAFARHQRREATRAV